MADTEVKVEDGKLFSKKGKGAAFRRRTKKKAETTTSSGGVQKQTAAHLRVQSDLADLDLPTNVTIKRAENEWLEFSLTLFPNHGYWKGAKYEFKFVIPAKYPFEGPKVQCVDKLYHPNIDLEGKVCVNVLRPWKPTYSIQVILFGLIFLFTHPNATDPLNNEAAAAMRKDATAFGNAVKRTLDGGSVDGVRFPRNRG